MSRARFDQTKHRSPLPWDFRSHDFGFIGPQWRGLDGDPDDGDKIRLRSRTGHLLRVVRSGAAAVTADNDVDVTLPPGFPRLDSGGLLLAASETEYAVMDSWPWTPAQMIGTDGFTVLVHFVEGGTISSSSSVALFNFGQSGASNVGSPSFEIRKGSTGKQIYQATLNHASRPLITPDRAYTQSDISLDDELILLAGVERRKRRLDVFLDGWVGGTRLMGAPFLAGSARRAVPSDWTDETAALNARDDGTEVGTNTIRRLAWDRGVHQGTAGLAHFGITLP